jgi:2-methylcitrate dehydratase
MRRIDKNGDLPNRAARDHSLQYIVATTLLKGRLQSEDYSDDAAADARIDQLRSCMSVAEDARYTRDHHDPAVRSCANAIEIELEDGSCSPRIEVLYPAGDAARRDEALPSLRKKFQTLTEGRWPAAFCAELLARCDDSASMWRMPIPEFMSMLASTPAI